MMSLNEEASPASKKSSRGWKEVSPSARPTPICMPAFVVVWTVAVQTGVVCRGLPFVRRVVAQIDRSGR